MLQCKIHMEFHDFFLFRCLKVFMKISPTKEVLKHQDVAKQTVNYCKIFRPNISSVCIHCAELFISDAFVSLPRQEITVF